MEFKISKNKAFEGEISFDNDDSWFCFTVRLTRHIDHAGLFCEFSFWKLTMYAEIHDTRHWNYTAKRWYLPGEEQAEIDAEGIDGMSIDCDRDIHK